MADGQEEKQGPEACLPQTLYGSCDVRLLWACACLEPGNSMDNATLLHCPPMRMDIAADVWRRCHTESRNSQLHTDLGRLSKVQGYLPCPVDLGHQSQAGRMGKTLYKRPRNKAESGVLQKAYKASGQLSTLLLYRKKFPQTLTWWREQAGLRWDGKSGQDHSPSSLHCSCVCSFTPGSNSTVSIILTSGSTFAREGLK